MKFALLSFVLAMSTFAMAQSAVVHIPAQDVPATVTLPPISSPSISGTGCITANLATGNSSAQNCSLAQAAVAQLKPRGCLYIPPPANGGEYPISCPVVIPSDRQYVRIYSEGHPVLQYTGADAALRIGDTNNFLYGVIVQNIGFDTAAAGPNASAIYATRTSSLSLLNLSIDTVKGGQTANGQTFITLDGGNSNQWSQTTVIFQPAFAGDVQYGVLLKCGQAAGNNAGMIFAGQIGGTTSGSPRGGTGFSNPCGDTWRIIGTDFEGWHIANQQTFHTNGPMDARYEGNDQNVVNADPSNTMPVTKPLQ